MLARYVPAQRMLFELLNPARTTERYRADPLAPGRYTADYLFASVMAAQPLRWMELSGLGRQDAARLQQIIGAVSYTHLDVYKRQPPAAYRQRFFQRPHGPAARRGIVLAQGRCV